MTAPRLVACYFTGTVPGRFERLAGVLERSARQHCPGWTLEIGLIRGPKGDPVGTPMQTANTHKLACWAMRVHQAAIGDRLLLMDADTMIVNSLDAVWDRPFDVAYTVKSGSKFPINAGVVFVRVSLAARAFFARWVEENARLLRNDPERTYRKRYGGLNQAALACVLQAPAARVVALPCAEWNCEDSTWASFTPARTRIVHVKGDLQRAIFNPKFETSVLAPLCRLWHDGASQPEARPA